MIRNKYEYLEEASQTDLLPPEHFSEASIESFLGHVLGGEAGSSLMNTNSVSLWDIYFSRGKWIIDYDISVDWNKIYLSFLICQVSLFHFCK